MIKIRTVTARNFLSIGNSTQAVNFDRQDLTLVLGENLDLGGIETGARNGVGKTAILNALSYVIYGQALTNIKKDNLINRTNGKNMVVTAEFEINGAEYRIERGRRPTFLKFFVNGEAKNDPQDEAQGDSRETQQDIERLIGMSHDMFTHIVALNTYTEPFLAMRANDQRIIIEQLLGITILSEKAERLKAQVKLTKDSITKEEFRIKAVTDANKRIEEQIENLRRRQRLWIAKHEEDVVILERALIDLVEIDIEAEIQNHRDLAGYHEKVSKVATARKWLKTLESDMAREEKLQDKLKKEIDDLLQHKCYACGGEIHDENHTEMLGKKQKLLQDSAIQWLAHETQMLEHLTVIQDIGDVGKAPKVIYDSLEKALDHRNTLEKLVEQLERRRDEQDPYVEQIFDMQDSAIEVVSWEEINTLSLVKEHQEFLLKLLTNKDSFIRKRIINQNLAYLNARLAAYLSAIGLPHQVVFTNDLSVEITELGRDLDHGNLSRGEAARVSLSLNFAFRDLFESLYTPINLLFVDEMIDNGMDASGVEDSMTILKRFTRERNRAVFLISHREELTNRVDSILKAMKIGGFTEYKFS